MSLCAQLHNCYYKMTSLMTSLIMHYSTIIIHYNPIYVHLQVNKGVTLVDLLSYANELEAQTDLMVRTTYDQPSNKNLILKKQHGSNQPHNVFSVY